MGKSSKPIIIMTVCVLLVVGIFSAVSIYNYRNVPEIDVADSPFGIQWGTSKEETESLMSAQGYEKLNATEEYTHTVTYIVHNYQNLEGVNGYAILNFDESLGFKEAILDFRTADSSGGLCEAGKIPFLYKSLRKSLNSHYEQVSYDSLQDYEYWQGEKVFVTLVYQQPDTLTIAYSSTDSVAERAEELAK